MIYTLRGDYYVRGLTSSDLDGPYLSWFEDQSVCRFNSHGKFIKTKEWLHGYYSSLNAEDKVVWAICHVEEGHIGNVSLQNISFINRSAEFAILIGNKQHWGKSVGLDASSTILRHGFHKLNLHRIYCGTADINVGMQRLAVKLGMTLEGRRRNNLFLEGEWVDMIEYGILSYEFSGINFPVE